MTKSMWIALFILMLLFAACGVFIVFLQKDEDQKSIRYFLAAHKINNALSYQEAALSVSDTAVLKNVSLKLHVLHELNNKIGRFSIHRYKETSHIPSFVSFTAKDISFSLIEAAQKLKEPEENIIDTLADFDPTTGILSHPLYALLLAGCDRISADVSGEYAYLPDKKRMTLKTKISDQCLGIWDAEISLGNISNAQQGQFVLALQHFLRKGDTFKNLQNFLKNATVTNFSLTYTDTELVKGYKRYIDTLYLRLPGTASPAVPDTNGIQKIVSYLSLSNAHRQRNTDVAQTLTRFIKEPQTIRFQSKKGKQVSLNVLGGTFLRQLTDLLLRLDTSVAVENTTP